MKTATVRQLRTEFPKVLAWVNAGMEVSITRRRQVVASLVPAGNRPRRKVETPDFRERLRRTYGDTTIPAAVMADILSENKGHF